MPADGPLSGRVAIVTGSSRGMGRGTAAHLASLGASVAVNYIRSVDLAASLVEEIRSAGGTAESFQADLTTAEGADSLVARTVDAFGAVDILVCNVGGFLRKSFEETTVDEWRWQFAQNSDTMFLCIRAAYPHMRAKGFGRIVTFSAAGAEFPVRQTQFVAYASAKAAVVAMTRALARELGPEGITVNCIAPGIVSDNAATRQEAFAIGPVKHTPTGRVGSAQDIAEAVAFLVRPDADYLTGAVLEVGGGWRL
ncbi:MAG TPA: SDR family oxidoreductase [Actinomycetota bacterium]|nr:SDR family oxidoreductase [Actinomycetota bacterium]